MAVRDRYKLGTQWPTIDPFLFCAHHHDDYPRANRRMGPDVSLDGRRLGEDFSGQDGWSMYHGRVVPGFPQHPHRGFETVSYLRRGYIDHSDSLGAAARYGSGDVQWLTAGSGIVHSEMFPLLDSDGDNPLELFQLWLNLAPDDKLCDPHFSMLWEPSVPKVKVGTETTVTVVAGTFDGISAPPPPPHSWAARPESEVSVWHISLGPGGEVELPGGSADANRTFNVFEGGDVLVDGERVDGGTGAVLATGTPLKVTAGDDPAEILVLHGRPIGAPVAQYGPFVMNDRAGIQQAFDDYQRTGFGGWPWGEPDPVHGRSPVRFARRPEGEIEKPEDVVETIEGRA